MTKARDLASIPAGSGDFSLTGDLVFASGQGIDFSASTSSESGVTTTSSLLDDYEEGTFTPVLKDNSSGGNTILITSRSSHYGAYIKVGNLVTALISIDVRSGLDMNGASGTNDLWIHGLPFAFQGEKIAHLDSWLSRNIAGLPSGYDTPSGLFISAGDAFTRIGQINTAGTAWNALDVEDVLNSSTTSAQVFFVITYQTA